VLRYFPHILPDELLYSTFGRYYKHTGYGSIKSTYFELYGNNSHVFSLVDFPYNIVSFLKQFENTDYTAEDIIFKFTMLPLFYPFLNNKMQLYSVVSMKSNEGKHLYKKLGVMASSINCLVNLKYCPECLDEDIKKYGDVYIHRSHNLDGVFVCHKHNKFLRTTCPICNEPILPKHKYNIIPIESVCINGHDLINSYKDHDSPDITSNDLKHYLSVAKITNFILNQDNRTHTINFNTLHDKYIYKLFTLDYLTAKGRIRQSQLKEDFTAFYGDNFLHKMKLYIDFNKPYCWLQDFLNKTYRAYHPLKHILFLIFICKNNELELQKILTDTYDYSINLFGKGPWPCLNPVADHYHKDVISDYTVTTAPKTKMPVGIFECNCGFIYTKHSFLESYSEKYYYESIKAFGHVWEETLTNIILNEGGSLRSIARKMHCDPKTVIRYTYRLGLEFCWESHPGSHYASTLNKVKCSIDISEHLCNQYKAIIQNYIMSFSTPPRVFQLRKLYEKEYKYLYKHDKKMLYEVLVICKNLPSKTNNKNKVNWANRDIELYPLVSNEIEQILSSKNITRITINKIGTDLGISYILEQYLDRLPKTQSLINSAMEPVEEYQLRRVRTIYYRLLNNNETLSKTKIYRIAGLKASCSDNVKHEVETLLYCNP